MAALLAALLCLAACAAEPAQQKSDQREASAPAPPELDTAKAPDAASPKRILRIGNGTLESFDGYTQGEFEVTIEDWTEAFGEYSPLAIVTLTNLETNEQRLGIGGSLAPRGDDRCSDTGFRSSSGDIFPDELSDLREVITHPMPAEAQGNDLYEIVLIANGTDSITSWEGCLNSVVARGLINWQE